MLCMPTCTVRRSPCPLHPPAAAARLAVDYVAAVEQLDEELPAFFAAINSRRPAGQQAMGAVRWRTLLSGVLSCTPSSLLAVRMEPPQTLTCAPPLALPPPADRPPLVLPAPQATRHFNADAKCGQGRQANSTWRGHVTLAPREQYCSTAEYFGERHPRCAAQVAAFWAADLRLLMAGAAADGSGGGSGRAAGGSGGGSGGSAGSERGSRQGSAGPSGVTVA